MFFHSFKERDITLNPHSARGILSFQPSFGERDKTFSIVERDGNAVGTTHIKGVKKIPSPPPKI